VLLQKERDRLRRMAVLPEVSRVLAGSLDVGKSSSSSAPSSDASRFRPHDSCDRSAGGATAAHRPGWSVTYRRICTRNIGSRTTRSERGSSRESSC